MLSILLFSCRTPDPPTTPTIVTADGVTLERSPNSALAIEVSWSTDRPGTSAVEFGDDGALAWRLSDPEPVTDHRLVIYGLRAEREVTVRVSTTFADGTTTAIDGPSIRTGPLPPSVPVGLVEVHDAARVQPGWTLLNVSNRDLDWPPTVAMYDAEGQPVWYAITADSPDFRGDLDVSLTDENTVLVGGSDALIHPVELTLAGTAVWYGPPQEEPEQHHHFQRLPDGTTALLRQSIPDDRPELLLDRVEVIDVDHEVVWSWDPIDHLAVPQDFEGDWMHLNAVSFTDEHAFINSRNLDLLYKVDRATGQVAWRLGPAGDFAPDPTASTPWFRGQHDPELQADGSWLFYDNRGLGADHARVIQLAVDEASRTTEVLWTFPGDFPVDPWYTEEWRSSIWGDADRLDNGNVLITAGTRAPATESRVFEVTEEGEVVWAMRLPSAEGFDVVGTYRGQRVAPPGLEAL